MGTKSNTLKEHLKRHLREWIGYLPLSDRQFNEIMYRHYFKRPLHLDPPVTFNEKIQWVKLFICNEQYTSLADKYAVREYVATKIGSEYLNELYGVYNFDSEIDFDALPQKFVLKATHGSGWNILCKDKYKLDREVTKRQLRKWLRKNYYQVSRELIYKNIPPKIVCERFLEDEKQNDLLDYKFFCFLGHVQFVQVDFDRFTNHARNIYDRNWALRPFTFIYPNNPFKLKRPDNFATMIEIAETLADKMPFARIDLYNVASKILFGEITFTPEAGFGRFEPPEWDYKLGMDLQIPHIGEPKVRHP